MSEVPPEDQAPSSNQLKAEDAKQYLKKFCPEGENSLYDHLTEVLSKILAERPRNAFASFEKYSRQLRDDKFRTQNQHFRDLYPKPVQYEDAKKLIKLFQGDSQSLEEENEDTLEEKMIVRNLFDLVHYTERADIGLPRSEIVLLNLSIRKLIASRKIKDVRFWGKFLGRLKNYYVIEASLSEEEMERRLKEMENEKQKERSASKITNESETNSVQEKAALEVAMTTRLSDAAIEDEKEFSGRENTLRTEYPPIPKNLWKPPPEVPPEKLGTGANSKVYFVCNSPGKDNWQELPSVTPQQIVIARQIVYIFTGNLERQIHSFPPFPGNEKNYLRAQIARIGSATHVSPVGYFTFGSNEKEEDEEEEEENDEDEKGSKNGAAGNRLVVNRQYTQLPMKALVDSSLTNWCHHSPYLLKQGRTNWQDPVMHFDNHGAEKNEDDDPEEKEDKENENEENEVEGNVEKGDGIEKEIGPPLLTPLSEDAASDFSKPWTARLSSNIQPDTAVAFIRSNIWPGAFAFAADKHFFNLYIGWGHKHNAFNYSPSAMQSVQNQYALDYDLIEIQDPSFEEEEAYRLSRLQANTLEEK